MWEMLFRATMLLLFPDKWNKRQELSPRGSGKLSARVLKTLTLQTFPTASRVRLDDLFVFDMQKDIFFFFILF